MTDVLLVVVTVAFFALASLLVRACDTIIGPDEDDLLDGPGPETDDATDDEPVMVEVVAS